MSKDGSVDWAMPVAHGRDPAEVRTIRDRPPNGLGSPQAVAPLVALPSHFGEARPTLELVRSLQTCSLPGRS
jgi:hypothetical protein